MSRSSRNLTNIPEGTCVCSTCNAEKDNTEFTWYVNRLTQDGFRLRVNTICIPCAKSTSKELREIKKSIKTSHPQPDYGAPCAMCKKPVYQHKRNVPSGVDGTWGWQCDHDHKTKQFRGWICKKCNTGLGGIGDTAESVVNAVLYKFGSINEFVKFYNANYPEV